MDASGGELLGLTSDELAALMVDWGEKPYHGRQLYGALYRRRQLDPGSMTELSKSLRRTSLRAASFPCPGCRGVSGRPTAPRNTCSSWRTGRRSSAF